MVYIPKSITSVSLIVILRIIHYIVNMKTITFTEENYLKAIYVLLGESTGRIANQSIANKLEINPATVTEMLHRLRDKKLIEYSRPEGARLTKVGKDLATKVVRKHRLWRPFWFKKWISRGLKCMRSPNSWSICNPTNSWTSWISSSGTRNSTHMGIPYRIGTGSSLV
jgi:DNA-binding MarR family transcriptional regulator